MDIQRSLIFLTSIFFLNLTHSPPHPSTLYLYPLQNNKSPLLSLLFLIPPLPSLFLTFIRSVYSFLVLLSCTPSFHSLLLLSPFTPLFYSLCLLPPFIPSSYSILLFPHFIPSIYSLLLLSSTLFSLGYSLLILRAITSIIHSLLLLPISSLSSFLQKIIFALIELIHIKSLLDLTLQYHYQIKLNKERFCR